MSEKPPNIFEYIDYRLFLKEYIAFKKRTVIGYSQRVLLRRMGITSTGFLANVIKGRNNLTLAHIDKLSEIMSLSIKESKYFKMLLSFARAKSVPEKNDIYQRMLSYRKGKVTSIDPSQDSLFRHWYFVVVKVLIDMKTFRDEYDEIGKMIIPPISEAEARKAVNALIALGMVSRNEDGILVSQNSTMSTGSQVQSMFLTNHHLSLMDLAKEALVKRSPKERDISGLTLSLSKSSMQLVVDEMSEFRRRLLQIAEDESNADRVVRCNFQIFPMAKLSQGDEL